MNIQTQLVITTTTGREIKEAPLTHKDLESFETGMFDFLFNDASLRNMISGSAVLCTESGLIHITSESLKGATIEFNCVDLDEDPLKPSEFTNFIFKSFKKLTDKWAATL